MTFVEHKELPKYWNIEHNVDNPSSRHQIWTTHNSAPMPRYCVQTTSVNGTLGQLRTSLRQFYILVAAPDKIAGCVCFYNSDFYQ